MTTTDPADAVTLIQHDHRQLEGLFARLQTGDGDRRQLVAEVAARLTAHARAEEAEVYPVLAGKADEQDEVQHGTHEHHEAEHKLRKVVNLVDSPHFEQALEEFIAAVEHHVEEEESELLPALKKVVDQQGLDRLGAAFERARREQLSTTGYETGYEDDRRSTAPAGQRDSEPADDQLAAATRDELYEKAKKADIPGRSQMKKDELIEALREQD